MVARQSHGVTETREEQKSELEDPQYGLDMYKKLKAVDMVDEITTCKKTSDFVINCFL